MLQYFMLFSLQAQMSACEWQLSGRIWYSTQSCSLDAPLDLSKIRNPALQSSTDFADIDASVVTAVQMGQELADNSQFNQLLDIGPLGALSNGLIIINSSIQVDNDVESLYVSVFGSFQGSLDNISISGSVNISINNPNLKQIHLSTFIGNTRPGLNRTISNQDEADFTFRNVKTELSYYLNEQKVMNKLSYLDSSYNIVQDPTTVEVHLKTVFDDEEINVPSASVDYSKLVQDKYTVTDNQKMNTFDVYTWTSIPYKKGNQIDNQFINAFEDLYTNSLQIQLEKFYETEGMMVRRFNDAGKELEMANDNDPSVVLTIYQEDTKAVAIRKDSPMVICEYPYFYDITGKQCVDSCITKFIFQSTCVESCPEGFYLFNNECWIRCPTWLGAIPQSGNNICQDCGSEYASDTTCTACPSSKFMFNRGCFDYCPPGTISDSFNKCSEPPGEDNCDPSEYFLELGYPVTYPRRFYSFCSPEKPSWLYNIVIQKADNSIVPTRVFKPICTGTALVNNQCIESSTPTLTPTECPLKDNKICRSACINTSNTFNNGYLVQQCSSTCNSLNYPQPTFGVCHICYGNYDGGNFYHRHTSKCISSCKNWSQTSVSAPLVCEDDSSCPIYIVHNDTSNECVSSCPDTEFIYKNIISDIETQCLKACPVGKYPDRVTNVCTANCQYLKSTDFMSKCEKPNTTDCMRIQGDKAPYQCIPSCEHDQFVQSDFSCVDYKDFNLAQCGMMLKSGVWKPILNCEINGKLNMASMPIINVVGLQHAESGSYDYYTAIDVDNFGILQNAAIIVNISIEINDQEAYIALFGQVLGRLENVTAIGYINITTNLQNTQLYLSKLTGAVNRDKDMTINSSNDIRTFVNVTSNIRFFVNTVEVTTDIYNVNFVGAFNGESLVIPTSTITPETYVQGNGLKLVASQYVFHQHDQVEEFTIMIYSEKELTNVLSKKFYIQSFTRYLETAFTIQKMEVKYFSAQRAQCNFEEAAIIVYFDEFRAMAIPSSTQTQPSDLDTVLCDTQHVYNPKSNSCKNFVACKQNGFVHKSLCLTTCPTTTYTAYLGKCYQNCPIHLGMVFNGSCIDNICPTGQMATPTQCIATNSFQCDLNFFPLTKNGVTLGCVSSCPPGTVTFVVNSKATCKIPTQETDCEVSLFIKIEDDERYYSRCQTFAPSSTYKVLISKTYSNKNPDAKFLGLNSIFNNLTSCDTDINPSSNQMKPFNDYGECKLMCLNGHFDNQDGTCKVTCPNYMVESKEFGTCSFCAENEYFDNVTRKCLSTAKYFVKINGHNISLLEADAMNTLNDPKGFKHYTWSDQNIVQCVYSCADLKLVQGDNYECVTNCKQGQVLSILNASCNVSCGQSGISTQYYKVEFLNGTETIQSIEAKYKTLKCYDNFSTCNAEPIDDPKTFAYNKRCVGCVEGTVWNRSSSDVSCIPTESCFYFDSYPSNPKICETPGDPTYCKSYMPAYSNGKYVCSKTVCGAEFYNMSNFCVPSCARYQKYTYVVSNANNTITKQCLDECPEKIYHVQGVENVCLTAAECASPTYKVELKTGLCKCNAYKFNGTCVDSCVDKDYDRYDETNRECNNVCFFTIVLVDGQQRKVCNEIMSSCSGLSNGQQCVGACPDTYFIDGQQCVISCDTGMYFPNNKTCVGSVTNCPYFIRNSNQRMCYASCPSSNPFTNGQECVKNCQDIKMVQSGTTCMSSCPGDSPFFEFQQCTSGCTAKIYYNDTKVCVSDIAECSVYIQEGDSKVCLKKCPKATPFTNNQLCVQSCEKGFLNWNMTCVTSSASCDMIDNYTPGNKIFNCTKSCDFYVSSVVNNAYQFTCYKSCADYNSGIFTYFIKTNRGGKCIRTCTDEITGTDSLVYYYVTNSQSYKQCVTTCNNITTSDITLYREGGYPFDFCVQKCKDGSSVQDNVCQLGDCPQQTPYFFIDSMKNKLCYSSCPKSYVIYNVNQCLVKCPENFKTAGQICVVVNKTSQTVMYIVVAIVMLIMAGVILFMEWYNKKKAAEARKNRKAKKQIKTKDIELGQAKKPQIKINIQQKLAQSESLLNYTVPKEKRQEMKEAAHTTAKKVEVMVENKPKKLQIEKMQVQMKNNRGMM
ncbi:Conserved_hypothetical protein [Hexamita inflata]|uniref:Uncharacterized protein n=1 Tax=Hexamita inflata TaxID=28002 RepID=A0AA86RCB4_9EUKA|nr:Conserved hypothetical protein [Hexamita inflata]